MDLLWAGVREALRLLLTGDREVVAILLLSLQVSGLATLISLALGIPSGAALALVRFPGRTLVVAAVNAGMGLPPVVVGLFVTLLLWRSGPLGGWEILYTPAAIVLAQAVIAAPTGKGNFEVAIALSLLLLVLVFGVNWALTSIQQRRVW